MLRKWQQKTLGRFREISFCRTLYIKPVTHRPKVGVRKPTMILVVLFFLHQLVALKELLGTTKVGAGVLVPT